MMVLGLFPVRIRAEDVQERYIQGLLDRELYRVAEEYLQHRLAEKLLPPSQQVELSILLSQTLSQHAALTQDSTADALWDEAARRVDQHIAAFPGGESEARLRLQHARVSIERGRWLRFELETMPGNETRRESATVHLRNAARQLIDLSLATEADASLPPVIRSDWLERIGLLLAECRIELALVLPVGPDRADAILQAADGLDVIVREPRSEQARWYSRLLRAVVARLQRDEQRQKSLLVSLLDKSAAVPFGIRDQALSEQARYWLEQNRPDEALSLLSERVQQSPQASAEVRAMIVETLLALWKSAADQGQAELQQQFLDQARLQLEATSGVWRRWAASRMASTLERQMLGEDVSRSLAAGRAAYQAGDVDRATGQFGEAVQQALARGLGDTAIDAGLTQGGLLLEQGRNQAAAEVYAGLVQSLPGHRRAHEASLLKCYALGKIVDAGGGSEETEAYRAALQGHLQTYPQESTLGDALWMLAVLEEHVGRASEAWSAFLRIPEEHDRFGDALARMAGMLERVAAASELPDSAQQVRQGVAVLAGRLDSQVPPPGRLSLAQGQVATRLAGLLSAQAVDSTARQQLELLAGRVKQSVDAEQRDAQTEGRAVDEGWNRLSQQLVQLNIVLLAGEQRFQDAAALLDEMARSNPADLLQVLHGLTNVSSSVSGEDRAALGRLQLQAARKLVESGVSLSPAQERMLEEAMLQACVATGSVGEALSIYERLTTNGHDLSLLRPVTRAVHVIEARPEILERLRNVWAAVEAREHKGTPIWFEARLEIARILAREGALADCRKLIGVTRLVYPELGGEPYKSQFLELLENPIPVQPDPTP